jgi:DNA mismatch endonuclease, patch repair protein
MAIAHRSTYSSQGTNEACLSACSVGIRCRRPSITPGARSRIMRAITRKDTRPEIAVRRLVHDMGYRFRLHVRSLPGTPDIVMPGRRAVIFVHGCFWHQHPGCKKARIPTVRQDYWEPKFHRNADRDARTTRSLQERGWTVIVVWECELSDLDSLSARLGSLIPRHPRSSERETSRPCIECPDVRL